ncbi:hypothetical protein AB0M22_31330 [Nocardia sp. NPDC051756]|uniref:hypothetical protein n=1 Tax=Nocardia sp. NPDC051756 TaxID=3154751 RepID=UPI003442EA20
MPPLRRWFAVAAVASGTPGSTEAATALNTAMFNLAIALGALFGGIIADNVVLSAVLWFGAGLSGLASLVVSTSRTAR